MVMGHSNDEKSAVANVRNEISAKNQKVMMFDKACNTTIPNFLNIELLLFCIEQS